MSVPRRHHRRTSGVTALAALAALCALLAGCVSIPADGPVVPAHKVENEPSSGPEILAHSPYDGSTPTQLVRDFLTASATFANDHERAREYLLPDPEQNWRPGTGVVIYSDITVVRQPETAQPGPSSAVAPPSAVAPSSAVGPVASGSASATKPSPSTTGSLTHPAPGQTAVVAASVVVKARIDASGQYTPARAGESLENTFRLVGTPSGWRIADLPNGILISQSLFERDFNDIPVYFADPMGRYLVPDVRWFARTATTTSVLSAIVGTLLGGPAPWLQSGVVTGAPAETKPTVNGVKIADGGVATVDLSIEARGADAPHRQMLKAQLNLTLTGPDQLIAPVSSIVVTAAQLEIQDTVPPGAALLKPPPAVPSSLVALDAKGAIVRVDGSVVTAVKGLPASLASVTNSSPAVAPISGAEGPGGGAYAVLTGGRAHLVYAVPDGQAKTMLTGRNLLPPSFDPFGWVWSGQEQTGNVLYAARPDYGLVRVEADALEGAHVLSLRLSREGARAIVVVDRGGRTEALVFSVVRGDASEVTSASWVDETHVAVLARRPDQTEPMPWIVEIGGDVAPTIAVSGAVSLSAVNNDQQLYVTAANGTVRGRLGSSWPDIPGVRWASAPG